MSRNKQENYLDELLNSVNADKSPEELEMLSLKSQLERMRSGGEDAFDTASSFSEERFLREFEQELDEGDFKDYIEEFEKELGGGSKNRSVDIDTDSEGLYVNTMDEDPEPLTEKREENRMDKDSPLAAMPEPEPENPMSPEEPQALDSSDMGAFGEIIGELNADLGSIEEPLPRTEDGEADLAGNSGSDLLDILGGDDGLSDLGDILSGEGDLGGEDDIANFAEQEMQQSEQAQEGEQEEGGKKKRRKKKEKKKKEKASGEEGRKGGFFARIAGLFFGPEEEEPKEQDVIVGLNNGSSASDLSDENQQILSEMDEENAKGKKKKEKKPKKEKPKKEKPKKEKAPKKEKPKKEKKPKPVDNTPPLPKGPVIMILVMVASMTVFVLIGTNLGSYQIQLKNAKGYFRLGDYAESMRMLQGESVPEKDEKFYNQVAVLAAVDSEIRRYETFIANGKQEMAFDSLVCAAGRYDINLQAAREWECTDELDKLKKKISKLLEENYKMEFDEAVDIYRIGDRLEYTKRLLEKLKELGLSEE